MAALHSPATGVVDFAKVAEALGEDIVATGWNHPPGNCRSAGPGRASGGSSSAIPGVIPPHRQRFSVRAVVRPTRGRLWRPGRTAHRSLSWRLPAASPAVRGSGSRQRLPGSRAWTAVSRRPPDPKHEWRSSGRTKCLDSAGPRCVQAGGHTGPRPSPRRLGWPGTWRLAARHWRAGLSEIHHAVSRRSFVAEAARLVPGLRGVKADLGAAGIRAQALEPRREAGR